ncbi:regulatory protein ArsR [Caldicellulosiruptor owensensis OL]|uniref:Regulatory protein ArsR n=1 Tax=Caldicellulosiruptor owensensis (strain ATCC 700167 / DSM 13100 / OL) TaxID=632518 RepID=E4Q720_CALOW|nr:metalloregulator ArsR/SmtB family transcription factor [Caldicellulosiruptor owensensis]ADQ05700.1 regulatory protein ArsR [Caldicellulosiruptor owensensis OL]
MQMEERLAKIFKALAHPIRVKIVEKLSEGEKCVCELLEFVEYSQPNLSQHLKILKEAGIIEHRKIGQNIHYRIKNDIIKNILFGAKDLILQIHEFERM